MTEKLKTIYDAIDDKKGDNIRIIDISEITTIADYFIVASGNNENQVKAIADNVTDEMIKKYNLHPHQIEGYNHAEWILIDYSDFVIHIFNRDLRHFYNIERLWSDGKEVNF